MVDQNTTVYSSSVSSTQNSSSGRIYVPVAEQRAQDICIDDRVEVTVSGIDDEFVNEVSFEGPQIASDQITVPSTLMRRFDLASSDSLRASFEKIEDDADESDDEPSDLGQAQGSVESNDESDDADESDDEEEQGLEPLFG